MRAGRVLKLSTRLMAVYAMLVAATILVVAGIVVLLTRRHLEGELDRQLMASVRSFENGPARDVGGPADLKVAAREWLRETALPADQLVVVRTQDGTVLSGTTNMELEDVSGARDLLVSKDARWWELDSPDGPVRALTVPIRHQGAQIGTLVSAAYESRISETLSALLSGIGLATALGLVFAASLGLATLRRTMRPLEDISANVESIEETGDLSRRIEHTGPRDEVGRLAESFDRTLGKLEEAFNSQRRFLSDASHELRTPITVARGQLELLEDALRNPQDRRSLALAVDELDRMRKIVEDLLLLARLDEGMATAREPVEIELVLREALLRGMLLQRRVANVDAEPGLFAIADPDRLLQVVTNLVTNAVQHTESDASISLGSRRDGDRAIIEIADTGSGIPEEDAPHVFERMYRGSQARAGTPAGAGLGLPIAASLVRAMDGTIEVASGKSGTTFTLVFPVAEAATKPDAGRISRDSSDMGGPVRRTPTSF